MTYEVTPLSDGRRLHVNMSKDSDTPFHVTQKDLALTENAEYLLSFEMQAEAGSHMKVLLNGEEHDIALSEKQDTYSLKFVYSGKEGANTLQFGFSSAGDYYLDKVRVEENVMIKNGSFNAGTSGYEILWILLQMRITWWIPSQKTMPWILPFLTPEPVTGTSSSSRIISLLKREKRIP